MTATTAGYRVLETVDEAGTRTLVRAIDPSGTPVLVKLLHEDVTGAADVARLEHECRTAASVPGERVVRPLGVEHIGSRIGLVLPDLGGTALSGLIPPGGFETTTLLRLAVLLAEAVRDVHEAGLIHRDLKPDNLVVDRDLTWLRIADFGLATRLTRLDVSDAPETLVGTLAYLAPEQSGRMGRTVDQRSDLYSVGVTLYQLATGRLPFEVAGALEMIHAHLASVPIDPTTLRPDLSPHVAAIVLRLLAKEPEDRYQSSAGLLHDLMLTRRQWMDTGRIDPFALGADDVGTRMRVPEGLFGRARELTALADAVGRAASGQGGLLLLSGGPGIGKTALVAELGPVIAEFKGRMAGRKFDQYSVGFVPPSELISGLTRQVLREPPEEVAAVRAALEAAVGANLGVLTEVAADLCLVVGEQPTPMRLGPGETQQRFARALIEFLGAFARPGSPLVLLLDDLQWARQTNMDLLAAVLADPVVDHLLVIGAYRPAEVLADHPLHGLVAGLDPTRLARLELDPLTVEATDALVSATLGRAESELVAWLHELTDGNPFYLRQVLETLLVDGLIRPGAGAEPVDVAAIRAHGLAGDVVDLLLSRLAVLPDRTRHLLRIAALLGNRFDPHVLATTTEIALDELAAVLDPAITAGLVVPVGDPGGRTAGFRFVHDRAQQAAYATIRTDELPHLHLRIGDLLRPRLDDGDDVLFEVVGHLNSAVELLTDDRRVDLIRWNLRAADRAKAASAYDTAARLLETAYGLMPDDVWNRHYRLAFDVHCGVVELLAATGRSTEADAIFDTLLAHAASAGDAALALTVNAEALFAAGRVPEALAAVQDGLVRLGLPNSHDDGVAAAMERLLDPTAVRRLRSQGDGTADAALAGRLYSNGVMFSYFAAHPDFVALVARGAEHILDNGVHPHAGMSIAYLAMHAARVHRIDLAVEYAEAALELVERSEVLPDGPVTMFGWVYCLNWSRDPDAQLEAQERGFRLCNEVSAPLFAGYALASACYVLISSGRSEFATREMAQRLHDYGERFAPVLAELGTAYVGISDLLIGDRVPARHPLGIAMDWLEAGPLYGALALSDLARNAALMGDYGEAQRLIRIAAPTWDAMGGVSTGLWLISFRFAAAVSAARLAGRTDDPAERDALLAAADENAEELRPFTTFPPGVWAGYQYLVDAEIALARGDSTGAAAGYRATIEYADRAGNLLLSGWAEELLGRLHLGAGRRIGRAHIAAARRSFERFGAATKVAALDEEFGQGRGRAEGVVPPDLDTVLSASQAIAAQTAPERVIEEFVAAAVRATGADGGTFVPSDAPPTPGDPRCERLEFSLRHKGDLLGMLLLERTTPFEPQAVAVLELLAPQVGISWENARLYADLEAKVAARSTELSATLAQLGAMQDQIIESEKLAALGGLVAGVAHEINNPIGVAVSAASHLVARSEEFRQSYTGGQLRRSALDEFVRSAADAADLILANADRAAGLVSSFKQVAVDQAGEALREFGLARYLADIVASLAPKLRGTGHQVQIDVPADLRLTSYPGAFAQVATNLVLNSLLHGYRDGRTDGRMRFAATCIEDWVRLEYSDDGVGIPATDLPRVFEAFFTTRQGAGGTGLGLHIVQNLVTQRLRGTIALDSTPGAGTRFVIELPQHAEHDHD